MRNKLNSIQRMEVTYGRISQSKILDTVLQSDAEKIKSTLEQIDQNAFESALDIILKQNIFTLWESEAVPHWQVLCRFISI